MPYSSNLSDVLSRMRAARDAALIAQAEVVRTAVKEGVRGGYVTGAFVTGHALNSVKRTEPYDGEGGRAVSVFSDVKYMLFWEVGFVPARGVFSPGIGRLTQGPIGMRRKEVWAPALYNTTPEQLAAFNRVFARFMGQIA